MISAPRACVIGWPVAHSRSPLIHNHWVRELGVTGSYELAAIEPDALPGFIHTMAGHGFVGGNVTIPHKEAVARLCGRLTKRARRLGSVNTLWFENDVLCGDSTDGEGFAAALDAEAHGWDRHRRQVVVLGAGGAARGIVDMLRERGFERILVANRTATRAMALCADLGGVAIGLDAIQEALAGTDLLVNTTPSGMVGSACDALAFDLSRMPSHAVVQDIVYVPLETPLLATAREAGLLTVNGLGMLLHQAVPGFQRWFGVRPRVTAALRALVEADIMRTHAGDGLPAR